MSKMLAKTLAIFLGLFIFSSLSKSAFAATVYVDRNLTSNCASTYSIANRNCSGSDGNGYKTVKEAVAGITAYDTVLVRAGTYREIVVQNTNPVRSSSFQFTKAMTIKGYPDEEAILTYDPNNLPHEDAELGPIIKVYNSDITIEHLTIRGTHALGDNATQDTDINIDVGSSSQNVVIRSNKILDFGHCGVKTGTVGLIVEYNEIANGGFTHRDHGIYTGDINAGIKTIRYNNFHDIKGYAIHLYMYAANYQIYGNLIHHNGEGGITLTGDHISIYNNTIYHNGQTSDGVWGGQGAIMFYHYGLHHLTIKNNIMWDNVFADLNCQPDAGDHSGNSFTNNIVGTGISSCNSYNGLNFWSSGGGNATITQDPKFVNGPSGDFHLQSTSVAINTGVNMNLATDYAGTAIPQGAAADIGAYEYLDQTIPKPGDANGDGSVNVADLLIWLANYKKLVNNGAAAGDFSGDGKVNTIDFGLWYANRN